MVHYKLTYTEYDDENPVKGERTQVELVASPFEYNAIPYQYRDDWYRNIMVKLFNEILAKKGKEQYEGTEEN